MKMPERCSWCGDDPLYVAYHDTEWGRPVRDGRALWETLILESFQSGLSWITILRKRPAFRTAFAGFDPAVIAIWGEDEVTRLLADPGIVRHRGKIEATLGNARACTNLGGPAAFADLVWRHVGHVPVNSGHLRTKDIAASTPASARLSADLRARGFRFCGPVTVHAFMQAAGLVNDHLTGCPWYADVMNA